jgi:Flp pilus assembly protein TadD
VADPMDDVDEALTLAVHYLEIGNGREALAALDRLGGAALEDPGYWLLRTTALRQLDRPDEAVDAARKGLALEPDEVSLLDSLAVAELDRDNLVEAERALRAALKQEPTDADLHAHLALTLARDHRVDEAWAAVNRALALEPDSESALRIRVQVAFLGDYHESSIRSFAAELLRVEPEDQTCLAILGALSARNRNYPQSARELAAAARLDPGNRDIAAGAREARVLAHPVLMPVRGMWRFGRWRAYFLFLGLSGVLALAHQTLLRAILVVAWLTIVVLSWLGPPILRRLERRRYGG